MDNQRIHFLFAEIVQRLRKNCSFYMTNQNEGTRLKITEGGDAGGKNVMVF